MNNLNQSILSKAFRGELVEQDPNDEPASVLLERIQKEREKEKAKVKQTGAKKLKK
jgi:type I restriction enzyme, S subunit